MLREKELKWFYQYGASEIYLEAWQGFLNEIPKAEHSDLIEAYRKIFNGADEEKIVRSKSLVKMGGINKFLSIIILTP